MTQQRPPKHLPAKPCPTCGHARALVNGDFLRWQRKRAKLTLREVAQATGYAPTYISDLELGNRPLGDELYEELARAWEGDNE